MNCEGIVTLSLGKSKRGFKLLCPDQRNVDGDGIKIKCAGGPALLGPFALGSLGMTFCPRKPAASEY